MKQVNLQNKIELNKKRYIIKEGMNMSSRTSLGQRNQMQNIKSNISSSFNLANQMSSKRLSMQFPKQSYININDQLNAVHIYQKYNKYIDHVKAQKDSYQGQAKNGKKEGFGSYTFSNQDQYIGYWENDQMRGMGVYIFYNPQNSSKHKYIGQFKQNKFNGIGKLILLKNKNDRDGTVVFQGFWRNGLKEGYGIYFYGHDISFSYQGYWSNDMKNGQGRLLSQNAQYSGYWRDDKKHGQGKLIIKRPQRTLIYEGEWVNDQLNYGQITYVNPLGSQNQSQKSYVGKLRNGKKDGQGVFKCNNIQMKGNFQNDYFTGNGTLTSTNSNYQIKGNFMNPRLQQFNGNISYPNGDRYNGSFDIIKQTILRKKGQYHYSSGQFAKGMFIDRGSKIAGDFHYTFSNGQVKHYNI